MSTVSEVSSVETDADIDDGAGTTTDSVLSERNNGSVLYCKTYPEYRGEVKGLASVTHVTTTSQQVPEQRTLWCPIRCGDGRVKVDGQRGVRVARYSNVTHGVAPASRR